MTIERQNLAGAFSPKSTPDRTAALKGVLPPVRPRLAAMSRTEPAPEPVEPSKEQRSTRAVASQTPPDTGGGVGNVAVYLEPDVLERLKAERRRTGRTYDELLVRAFDDVSDDVLRQAFAPWQAPTQSAMPQRQRRVRGTAGIQVNLRIDRAQVAWLTEKQNSVGAPSRSALAATALRLHLTARG